MIKEVSSKEDVQDSFDDSNNKPLSETHHYLNSERMYVGVGSYLIYIDDCSSNADL